MNSNMSSYGNSEVTFRPIHYVVVIISFLIFLANGTVIYLFSRYKSLRTVSNKVLTSLAVVDLIAGLLSPLFMSCDLSSDVQTRLLSCIASSQISRFLALSCIYHIIASTVEKLYAISCPLKHRCASRSHLAYKGIVFLWLIPLFIAVIPLMWIIPEWNTLVNGPHNTTIMQDILDKTAAYDVACAVIGFVIPFFFLVIAFTKMYIIIRREFNRIQENVRKSRCVSRHSCFVIAQTKPLLVFTLLLFIYSICWFPFFLGSFAISYNLVIFPNDIESVFVALRYINCFLNPLCYALLKSDFKGSLQSFCTSSHTSCSSVAVSNQRESALMHRNIQQLLALKHVPKQVSNERYSEGYVMSGKRTTRKLNRRHTIN